MAEKNRITPPGMTPETTKEQRAALVARERRRFAVARDAINAAMNINAEVR